MLTGDSEAILAVNIAMPLLAFIAVALRVVARTRKSLSLKLDDYLVLVALVYSATTLDRQDLLMPLRFLVLVSV